MARHTPQIRLDPRQFKIPQANCGRDGASVLNPNLSTDREGMDLCAALEMAWHHLGS